jgi:trk system potassium uptake protein
MKIVIIGCGRMGSSLAAIFSKDNNVVVVDRRESAFRELDDNFPGEKVLGDSTDSELLKKAGISGADLVLVLTNEDNTNLMVSQIIKQQFKVKRNICRVDDPVRARAYEELGVETFCPTVFSVELLKKICTEPKRKKS